MPRSSCFIALFAIVFAFCIPIEATAQSYIELAPWDPPITEDPPALATMERLVAPATGNFEKQSSLNGTQYTVLTPIFTGENSNFSYIRLTNAGITNATFFVTVVGSPKATNYGTTVVTVAPRASPQFSITDILNSIGVTGFASGDDSYSIYLRSPQGGNFVEFQHVVWNSLTGFFENGSLCTYRPDIDYSVLNQALGNIHTSRISSYPGIVFLHNYAPFAVTYLASVFDANNGAYLGAVNFNMSANATLATNFSAIEEIISFFPTSNQFHVNMLFQAQLVGNQYFALAAQAINNLQLFALTNMSVACAVNPS